MRNNKGISFGSFQHGQQQWFFGVGLIDAQLQGQCFSFDLVAHVGLTGEDAVGVVHVVELEEFLDETNQFLSVLLLEQFLALDVLPVERGDLRRGIGTFLSVLGSSTILKTLERIWALMLESCPLASRVWMTRFFSSLSYYI